MVGSDAMTRDTRQIVDNFIEIGLSRTRNPDTGHCALTKLGKPRFRVSIEFFK